MKIHVTFKSYNWKWSEKNCWPPWKYVVTAAIWSDPTYAPLRDALKRPVVNPEVKMPADVYFITVNIGSEAPEAGVTNNKSLDGVMHITGMASGTPLHCTVTCRFALSLLKFQRGIWKAFIPLSAAIWCLGRLFSLLAPLVTSWECWVVSESCTTTRG